MLRSPCWRSFFLEVCDNFYLKYLLQEVPKHLLQRLQPFVCSTRQQCPNVASCSSFGSSRVKLTNVRVWKCDCCFICCKGTKRPHLKQQNQRTLSACANQAHCSSGNVFCMISSLWADLRANSLVSTRSHCTDWIMCLEQAKADGKPMLLGSQQCASYTSPQTCRGPSNEDYLVL